MEKIRSNHKELDPNINQPVVNLKRKLNHDSYNNNSHFYLLGLITLKTLIVYYPLKVLNSHLHLWTANKISSSSIFFLQFLQFRKSK